MNIDIGVFRTLPNINDGDLHVNIVKEVLAVNYFPKKGPSQMFNRILNTPLIDLPEH